MDNENIIANLTTILDPYPWTYVTVYCALVGRECVDCDKRTCGNPVITFQVKKRINSGLFIGRTAALYIGETQIRVVMNESDQPVALADWRCEFTLRRNV